MPGKTVAVIGGGLVGPVIAMLLKKRGFKVEIYEKRKDPRILANQSEGRSFDLALSKRGLDALNAVDEELKEKILREHTVRVDSRLIHDKDGTTRVWKYGKGEDACLHSMQRKRLNEIILNEAEARGIKIHFHHRLSKCDIHKGDLEFEVGDTKVNTKAKVHFIIGCDGAHSAVRMEGFMLSRETHMNYQQYYIAHGYREIQVPADVDGNFAFEEQHLHLWPRNNFMLMGLPNPDKSFTMTLFMPFEMFDELNSDKKVIEFFQTNFPDAIDKIGGKHRLVKEYGNTKTGSMISIKCHPHHATKALLLGDAAHAMVPFYGQGVNAGFEDCIIFCDYLDKTGDIVEAAKQYSTKHRKNAEAIVELSLYNYDEMRESMNSTSFRIKGFIGNKLHKLFPAAYTPLYTMVAFTRLPYSKVVQKHIKQMTWQEKLFTFLLLLILLLFLYMFMTMLFPSQMIYLYTAPLFIIAYMYFKSPYEWKYRHF